MPAFAGMTTVTPFGVSRNCFAFHIETYNNPRGAAAPPTRDGGNRLGRMVEEND